MASEAKVCEACGAPDTGMSLNGWSEYPNENGARLCSDCGWGRNGDGHVIASRIRERRRSAPQHGRDTSDRQYWACGCIEWPSEDFRYRCSLGAACKRSAPQQAQVEAGGFKVGDRVVGKSSQRAGEVIGINAHGMLELLLDKSNAAIGGTRERPYTAWPGQVHLAAAQPAASGKRLCAGCRGELATYESGRCQGCEDDAQTPGAELTPVEQAIVEDTADRLTKRHGYTAPAPSLAAFTASIAAHLEPHLPAGVKAITDVVGPSSACFGLWILDGRRELYQANLMGPIDAPTGWRLAGEIARTLMSRLARPASELERGREVMAILDEHGNRCDRKKCEHTEAKVDFDPDMARHMSAQQVRTFYPRFWGRCPGCGVQMIKYASKEHYVMGDW